MHKTPRVIYGITSHWGRITFGHFTEKFILPLTDWTLLDYKQQWKECIKRLEHEHTSCFITTVQNLQKDPLIILWPLYQENGTIFLQNRYINKGTEFITPAFDTRQGAIWKRYRGRFFIGNYDFNFNCIS